MLKNIQDIKGYLDMGLEKLLQKFPIKLFYIFGSFAKGTNHKNSDLDIAVLLEGEPDSFIKLELLDELVGIFKTDTIDLTILNNADEVLRFQVIKYGKVLYMKDLTTKVTFETKTMSEYVDMEYFRNVQSKYSHERLLEIFSSNRSNGDGSS